jgi:hypothetical protein
MINTLVTLLLLWLILEVKQDFKKVQENFNEK